MGTEFDIAFVTSHFSTCSLSHYLDLIRGMSNTELRNLRKEVRKHKRNAKKQQAFRDAENITTHQAIIKAINHELLRRSFVIHIAIALFPIRKFFVNKFSGLTLKFDDRFGVMYSKPEYRRTFWHIPHKELSSAIWHFVVRNERTIFAATLAGIGWLIVRYFT